jgi:DNA polymerase-3 subunit gamma/tau
MVTTAGFNALLKLVEEPPEHVRFIFATTEADKVLPTIRSRTHNYTFRLVPSKTLQSHLAYVCEAEGVAAEAPALALVARAGAGSVRDSLSVLGQVISGSGEGGVTYAEAVAQLGMTDATLLDESIDALADHDGSALFTVIDKVIEAGHDPRRFVTDLLERFRDLIVLHNVPNAAELGLIDAPEDQVAREIAQSQRFGPAELTRAADVTSAALSELRGATAPRLHLELMAARLLLPASDADEAGNRARLDQLERRMAATPIHATAAPADRAPEPAAAPTPPKRLSEVAPSTAAVAEPTAPTPAAAPAPTPAAEPATAPASAPRSKPPARPRAGAQAAAAPAAEPAEPAAAAAPAAAEYAAGLDQFVSMWPAVLEAVKSYSRVGWMAFNESRPISLSNGILAVAVADAGKVNNVKSSGHDERLRQAIIDVMKTDVKIDVVLAPDRAIPVPAASGDAPVAPVASSEPDAPSMDDPDSDGAVGVDLALRELGATRIGEIEH